MDEMPMPIFRMPEPTDEQKKEREYEDLKSVWLGCARSVIEHLAGPENLTTDEVIKFTNDIVDAYMKRFVH